QHCIVVNYIIAGSCEEGTCHSADGFWTLEVRDHALGRLLSRQTGDPLPAILEAHHAALRLRRADIIQADQIDPHFTFYLPAGPGAFSCSGTIARDISTSVRLAMGMHCHTWLSDDQLRDAQVKLIDDGQPGHRLGDHWLLPAGLREV